MQETDLSTTNHEVSYQTDNSSINLPSGTNGEQSIPTNPSTTVVNSSVGIQSPLGLHTSTTSIGTAQYPSTKRSVSMLQRSKKRGAGPQTLYVRPSGPAAETFILNRKDDDKGRVENLPFRGESLDSGDKDRSANDFPGVVPCVFSKLSTASGQTIRGFHTMVRGLDSPILAVGAVFLFFLVVDILLLTQARLIIHSTLLIRTELNEELLFFVSSLGESYYQKNRKLETLMASSPNGPRTLEQARVEAEVKLLECMYNRSLSKFHRELGYLGDISDLQFLLNLHFMYEDELRTMMQEERHSVYLSDKIRHLRKNEQYPSAAVTNRKKASYPHSITEQDTTAASGAMDLADDLRYTIDAFVSTALGKAQLRNGSMDINSIENGMYYDNFEYTRVKEGRFTFLPSISKGITRMGKSIKGLNDNEVKSRSFLLKRFLCFILMCVILYVCFYFH
ncbi:unnamed protein product [Phytomonas sp. EM1]|nr:unnamed protein product [Phytomonas sp. EM1]|eukprot:CCW60977.1 unnamed protein product [Phytomonas sp. isolate EM1]